MIHILGWLYLLAATGLALYGFLGLFTLWLYWRHRHDTIPQPVVTPTDLPSVTVQLPIFNERYVIKRLIDAAVAINYPADRLQIQVIDDSTDDTTETAVALVNQYQNQGINISLVHRRERVGYKAGALANAMPQATGKFIAIFDADFQPQPEFLKQTIPYFCQTPELGMIQARWGHLNREDSPLTAAQAIAIDKHFAMEQTVRHRANLFPKFNGAGGIWRRACLEDAGGWQDDTVCEDLCLSTRAILKKWQFRFLSDVEAPAELPTSISAYKNQQARWAKGSFQCLQKFGRPILSNREQSITARFYALFSMSAYAAHFFLLIVFLLQVPLIFVDYQFPPLLIVLGIAGIGQPLLFVIGQQVLHADWLHRLWYMPALMLVGVGLAPNNSRAMLQAMFGRQHPFVRTPKRGERALAQNRQGYKLPFDWILLVEILLTLYAGIGLILSIFHNNTGSIFLLLTCFFGFGYVSYLGIQERRPLI